MREKINNLKIGKKLFVTFSLIIAGLLIYVVVSFVGLLKVGQNLDYFYTTPYRNNMAQLQLRRDVQSVMKNILWLCTTDDEDKAKELRAEIDLDIEDQNVQLEFLKKNSSATDLLGELETAMGEAKAGRSAVLEYVDNKDYKNALTSFNEDYSVHAKEVISILKEIGTFAETNATNTYDEAKFVEKVMIILAIIIALVIIAFTVWVGQFLTKLMTKPIFEIESAAKSMAGGDLDVTITYDGKDELGSLAANLKEMMGMFQNIIPDVERCLGSMADGNFDVKSSCHELYVGNFQPILVAMQNINSTLSNTLGQIKSASEQVNDGASNMSQGAQNLAEGATEQASSVQELTATIEDLAEQSSSDAKKAEEAEETAKAVEAQADQSKNSMENMVESMKKISALSSQIEAIINTIDDIAFQTNLLSLNASIEAARAGEAGKGFAVVAGEIGKLASESAEAAKNTRELIQNTVYEVDAGNTMVKETSTSIQEVLQSVNLIGGVIHGLMESAQKQSGSMAEVKNAVEQISTVIQSTSATAEESSAISEELFAQSETLNGLVDQFVLNDSI